MIKINKSIKKPISFLFLLIVLSIFYTICALTPNVAAYDLLSVSRNIWSLNNVSEQIDGYDITLEGGTFFRTALNGYGLLSDGVSDNAWIDNIDNIFPNTKGFTVNIWVKSNDSTTSLSQETVYHSFKRTQIMWMTNESLRFSISPTDNDYGQGCVNGTIDLSTWTMLTGTYNETTGLSKLYVNGNLYCSFITSTNPMYDHANSNLNLDSWGATGSRNSNTFVWKGLKDEFYIFDVVLEQTDINNLYNFGSGLFYPFISSGSNPYLSFTTDINESINYSYSTNPTGIFYFNVSATVINDSGIYTGYAYLNNTLMKQWNDTNLNSITELNFSVNNIECTDCILNITFNNSNCSAFKNYTVFLDFILPTISGFTNHSSFNFTSGQGGSITFNWTLQDTNLDFYIIETKNIDLGSSIDYDILSGITTNIYKLNQTITINSLTSGMAQDSTNNFYHNITVGDSHTIKIMPSYDWEKYQLTYNDITYKGIKFNNNKLNLSTSDYQKVNDFYLIKKSDRYLMAFNFTETDFLFTMYIGSSKSIRRLNYTRFQGHFIINNKHWLDWVSDDIYDFEASYLKNYDLWRIRFKPKTNIVVFNSIGDLNIVNEIYYFNVSLLSSSSLTSAQLDQLISLTETQNDLINEQNEGINLIGYIFLYIATWILYIVKREDEYTLLCHMVFWILGYIFLSLGHKALSLTALFGIIVSLLRFIDDT